MIPAKPLDRAISDIKYRFGKYYVRMDFTPPPSKVRLCRDFSNPSSPLETLTLLMNGPLPYRSAGFKTMLRNLS